MYGPETLDGTVLDTFEKVRTVSPKIGAEKGVEDNSDRMGIEDRSGTRIRRHKEYYFHI